MSPISKVDSLLESINDHIITFILTFCLLWQSVALLFSRISVPSSVIVLETCSYHFPAQLVDMVDDGLLALG